MMGFLVAPFKLFLMRSCTVASRTSTLKFETKEMSFVPRERNFLVLEPGSFSLKGNVASYIDRPEHALRSLVVPNSPDETMCDSAAPIPGYPLSWAPVTEGEPQGAQRTIVGGRVAHWKGFQDEVYHLLHRILRVVRVKNDKPVIVSLPLSWGRDDVECLTQFLFEVMNVPGLFLLEQPLAAVYGYGVTGGMVLDLGYETIDMAAVIDNVTVRQGASSIELGAKDIMTYLAILLKKDEARVRSKGFTGPIDNPSLLTALLESGLVVSFLPGIVKDSDVPVVDFVFEGVKIPIGSSRLRCTDVLFDPSLVGKEGTPSLFEALQVTIQASADAERRMYLWENLILAGGLSALPGLKPRLEKESTLYLSASETSNENQAKEVGWVKIPDYFLSFKDRAQDMAFVGASVVAKVMFLSTANYITKTDYNEHGPSITHSK